MQHLCTTLVTTLALIVFGAGCEADRPNAMNKPDAAVGEDLKPPQLMDIPTSTPNDTIAVRGSTNGLRVVVNGGPGDPQVRPVLPSGSFCVDVPIDPGQSMLQAYALKDGLISPAAFVTVNFAFTAPAVGHALAWVVPRSGERGVNVAARTRVAWWTRLPRSRSKASVSLRCALDVRRDAPN